MSISIFGQTDPGSLRFEKVASWPGFARGETRDLQVVNGIAYMAMGDGGLCIADYSNPANPKLLSRLDLDGSSEVIKVDNGYAYLCSGTAGFHIVNIANPSTPSLVARYNSGANIKEVAFTESFAFLAAGTEGVIALDISNPAAPTRVGAYDTKGEGLDVEAYTFRDTSGAVTARYLWVADGTNGIVYLDATAMGNIKFMRSQTTEGTIAVERVGRYFFFLDSHPSDSTSSLWFNDALYFRGTAPDSVAGFFSFSSRKFNLHLDATGIPSGAWVQSTGGSLYGASFKIGSGPGQGIVGYGGAPISNPTSALGVSTEGTNDFISVAGVGIQAMGGTNVLGVFAPGGSANHVRLAGDRVYLGDTYQGFHTLQANADGTVTHLSTYLGGFQRGFDVAGSNVFLAAGTNVQILDVSNAAQPIVLTNLSKLLTNKPTTISPRDIKYADNRIYVGGLNMPFGIFDVSKPAQPALLALDPITFVSSIEVVGTNLFVALTGGFFCFAIDSNFRSFTLNSISYSSPSGLDLVGSTAYLGDRANGLRIIDVSDPSNPVRRSTLDTLGSAVGVKVVGNLAYVADTQGGRFHPGRERSRSSLPEGADGDAQQRARRAGA